MSPSGSGTGSVSASRPTNEAAAGADRVLAVLTDLFFVARIRETARMAGVALTFARSHAEVVAAAALRPRLALVDLTSPLDLGPVLDVLAGVPVLGYTTHADAARTKPWHARCDRVVTKETLTRELPELLRRGLEATS